MKRNTKRRAITALAVVAVAATLAACSGGTSGAKESDPAKDGSIKGAKLTMWIPQNAFADQASAYANKWAKKEGVDLKVTLQPTAEFQGNLALALRTNSGPDVWNGANPTIREFAHPLDNVLSKETLKAYAKYTAEHTAWNIHGKIVGLPTTVNTFRLAYNRDLFKEAGLNPEPPTSLDDMRADCEAIVANTDKYCIGLPVAWPAFAGQDVDPISEISHANLSNNGLFNVKTGKFAMKNYAPVIDFFREAIKKEWAYPGSSSLDIDTLRATFAKGQIGMFNSAAWDMAELNGKYHTTVDWAAAPLPTVDGRPATRQLAAPGNPYLMNKATKSPKAAGALIDALASTEFMKQLADAGLAIPARTDVKVSKSAHVDPQYPDYAVSKLDTAPLQSPASEMSIKGDTIYQAIASLVLGSGDVDSTLAKYNTEYQKEYEAEVAAGTIDPSQYVLK